MGDENTFVKPSEIHGLGLFAGRNISKGEQIIQGRADYSFRDEWVAYLKKNKEPSFEYNNGYCMINHAANPNTERGEGLAIVASRNILKGEEITENYYALSHEHNPFTGFNLEKMVYLAKQKRRH